MRLALLGPPGSGKGTQAQRICETFDLVHLASGDILRVEKASGSALGRQIRDFIDNGLLVPDDLMIELMKQKILSLNTASSSMASPAHSPRPKRSTACSSNLTAR